MAPILDVKLMYDWAVCPSYGSEAAIGLDVFPSQCEADGQEYGQVVDCVAILEPGQVNKIHTGVKVAIPDGWYGRLAPKSGPAVNYGVNILAGVIDSDYRGELIVLATTITKVYWPFSKAIAQLILERADRGMVRVVDELTTTARGSGGFGSTGR